MVPQLVHPLVDYSLWPDPACDESWDEPDRPGWDDTGGRLTSVVTAVERLVLGEVEPALEELEAALDELWQRRQRRGRAECAWWAGLASYQLGLAFQAQGYWQAALPDVEGAATLGGVCRALSIASLGGAAQALALFEATLESTDYLTAVAATRGQPEDLDALLADLRGSPTPAPSVLEPEPVLSRALALCGIGMDAAALEFLEGLQDNSEMWKSMDPFRLAIKNGLLQIAGSSPEMRSSGFDRRELGRVQ